MVASKSRCRPAIAIGAAKTCGAAAHSVVPGRQRSQKPSGNRRGLHADCTLHKKVGHGPYDEQSRVAPALARDARPAHSGQHPWNAGTRDERCLLILPATVLADHTACELLFSPVVEEELIHHVPSRAYVAADVQHLWGRCIGALRWRSVLHKRRFEKV